MGCFQRFVMQIRHRLLFCGIRQEGGRSILCHARVDARFGRWQLPGQAPSLFRRVLFCPRVWHNLEITIVYHAWQKQLFVPSTKQRGDVGFGFHRMEKQHRTSLLPFLQFMYGMANRRRCIGSQSIGHLRQSLFHLSAACFLCVIHFNYFSSSGIMGNFALFFLNAFIAASILLSLLL